MRGYVVTLLNIPESIACATRCTQSARQFGLDADLRAGVWRDVAQAELKAEGLKAGKWDTSWSNTDAVLGNFVAQYRIWREIEASGEPGIVMEHDAVVVARIPAVPEGDIVNMGKPSFGAVRPRTAPGFYPLFSGGDKIPGAHGYYLTPAGATQLVQAAQKHGGEPVDKFINPQRFQIREYWPWPIEARDSFTTIQREKGCRSKHNWKPGYRIF